MLSDVVVVGAGPGGFSTAMTLERLGYDIRVVDRHLFPRNKPCAGVLPPRIFSEIEIPDDIIERSLEGYRIFSPSGRNVESVFPRPGAIVRRERLDDYNVKRMNTDVTRMHVSGCNIHDGDIEIIGRDGSALRARVVVGADGAGSIVRKSLGMNSGVETVMGDYALAIQVEIELSEEKITQRIGNWFEVYYTIPFGYGWISPLENAVKVGIGSMDLEFKRNSRAVLSDFLSKSPIKEKVAGGMVGDMEAHLIPMRGPWPVLAGDRCLVVGDAGGFVFPGTGEGVFYAIKSGRIAANVIHRAFEKGNLNAGYLDRNYTEQLNNNGLLSLREVDFPERVLSNPENVETYVTRLMKMRTP